MSENNYKIAVVERAMKLLELMAENNGGYSLTEMAQQLDCSVSSVSRLLETLQCLGYIDKEMEKGRYYITEKIKALENKVTLANPLLNHYRELIKHLAEQYTASVSLVDFVGREMIGIYNRSSFQSTILDFQIHRTLPAYCTSAGILLLSQLPEAELNAYFQETKFVRYAENTVIDEDRLRERIKAARASGVAYYNQEYSLGIWSMAILVPPEKNHKGCITLAVPYEKRMIFGRKGTIEEIRNQIRQF